MEKRGRGVEKTIHKTKFQARGKADRSLANTEQITHIIYNELINTMAFSYLSFSEAQA